MPTTTTPTTPDATVQPLGQHITNQGTKNGLHANMKNAKTPNEAEQENK